MDLIKQADLLVDSSSKAVVRFGHRVWWEIDALKAGEGWTKSGRILLFEFDNRPNQLDLRLYIGPGPSETRQRLIEIARRYGPPFTIPKNPGERFTTIYRSSFLQPHYYKEAEFESLESHVRERWDAFVRADLPRIVDAFQAGLETL